MRNRKETKPRIGSSKGRHRQGNRKEAKKSDGERSRKKKGTRRRNKKVKYYCLYFN
jgi:hypothetical protein